MPKMNIPTGGNVREAGGPDNRRGVQGWHDGRQDARQVGLPRRKNAAGRRQNASRSRGVGRLPAGAQRELICRSLSKSAAAVGNSKGSRPAVAPAIPFPTPATARGQRRKGKAG